MAKLSSPAFPTRIFESVLDAHLSQTRGRLFYWREGKFEVVFVVELDGKIYAIAVKSGRK